MRFVWKIARWLIALAVIGFWLWELRIHLAMAPMMLGIPFEEWYGDWESVGIASALFLSFVLVLAWPRGQAEWRNAGIYSAFLISLFFEMFGLPLTIFLLSPLVKVPIMDFSSGESHLWAYALYRAGLMPLASGVHLMMAISMALIALGMTLLAVGWAQVFGARHELVTRGIYRFVRHPQYLGLILILIAFNIQWPTLLTLMMAPLLIVVYVRQARREDAELKSRFGDEFSRYAASVPAFIPALSRRAAVREAVASAQPGR